MRDGLPQVFKFEGVDYRVYDMQGDPWFVGAEVCKALDIRNSRDALARLDDDEKGVVTTDTLGGPQRMTVINESGLYSLILKSRKPEAKRFKKWITAEVLPTMRRTGRYAMSEAAAEPAEVSVPVTRYIELLEAENAQLRQAQRRRVRFTDAECNEMLHLAREGLGSCRIAKRVGRAEGSVSSFLSRARKEGLI